MFATLVRRLAQAGKEPVAKRVPLTIYTNPHKARKLWPPDFRELNSQQQLRFEKKYKRRIRMASHSPRWIKGTKYAQLVTTAVVLVYIFFYADFEFWGQEYKPSVEMRRHAMNVFGVMDPEKRYERREDAPETGVPTKGPASQSK
ncbi:hypothetical protein HRG_008009 [Hirsutella rhossiliensis]|uniref:Uncharacterized protein n=1 Tax=Hirsutella rhossiliensis TaxID=111463 RepID=A0A9P8SFK9_9HYPO|nr:uncharacterized protein HRG_08009 [Hirsutella rhossiliensis]KAH0960856.1 hypothetical protein HRG_08009 [Hirsutella rhossiliensis]